MPDQTYHAVLADRDPARGRPVLGEFRCAQVPTAALRREGPVTGNPAQTSDILIMKTTRAIQILTALVEGRDPQTGNELSTGTPLQSVDVLRALLVGITALKHQAGREIRRADLPPNVGARWTADEERRLVTEYRAGESLDRIADICGRTVRAIEVRLERLGLLTAPERTTTNQFLRPSR